MNCFSFFLSSSSSSFQRWTITEDEGPTATFLSVTVLPLCVCVTPDYQLSSFSSFYVCSFLFSHSCALVFFHICVCLLLFLFFWATFFLFSTSFYNLLLFFPFLSFLISLFLLSVDLSFQRQLPWPLSRLFLFFIVHQSDYCPSSASFVMTSTFSYFCCHFYWLFFSLLC